MKFKLITEGKGAVNYSYTFQGDIFQLMLQAIIRQYKNISSYIPPAYITTTIEVSTVKPT
jgi:hypothetical protein